MAYDDRDDDDDPGSDLDVRRRGEPIPNYLTQAILVTLCCCVPFGIVAIISASKVNSFVQKGEYEQAASASADAKKWCLIGFLLGLPANIAVIAIQIWAEGMK